MKNVLSSQTRRKILVHIDERRRYAAVLPLSTSIVAMIFFKKQCSNHGRTIYTGILLHTRTYGIVKTIILQKSGLFLPHSSSARATPLKLLQRKKMFKNPPHDLYMVETYKVFIYSRLEVQEILSKRNFLLKNILLYIDYKPLCCTQSQRAYIYLFYVRYIELVMR